MDNKTKTIITGNIFGSIVFLALGNEVNPGFYFISVFFVGLVGWMLYKELF